MIPTDTKKMHKQFDEYLKTLSDYSTTGDLLVPNGHDQMPVQQNIFEIMDIMRKEFPDYDVEYFPLSLSIGAHIGPGSIAVGVSTKV